MSVWASSFLTALQHNIGSTDSLTPNDVQAYLACDYGVWSESVSCKAYEAVVKRHHINLTIKRTGLCVSATDAYLHASPDAIVT